MEHQALRNAYGNLIDETVHPLIETILLLGDAWANILFIYSWQKIKKLYPK